MTLWQLVLTILTDNLLSFGTGPVMVPLLQKQLVDSAQVLSIDQFLFAFAIGRVTPGQGNVYVASIGFMLFGFAGAILSTLALQLPGYVMIPLLRGYEVVRASMLVRRFTRGLVAASVGLIFSATLNIARPAITGPLALGVFGLTFVLAQFLKWNSIVSLAVASAVGILLRLLLGPMV